MSQCRTPEGSTLNELSDAGESLDDREGLVELVVARLDEVSGHLDDSFRQ